MPKTKKAPAIVATEILTGLSLLESEIAKKREKAGLPELEMKRDAVKKELTEFMTANEVAHAISPDGAVATLVKASYDSRFIATAEDFEEMEEIPDRDVIPLREIVKMKYGVMKKGTNSWRIWNRITKRVVQADKLEEVISEGLLTVDEVAPSFVQKQKKPYVRVTR